MSHLEDRLAEFVFEELTESEMEAARQHVAQCLECQGHVAGFRKVQHSLEQLPDMDVPRRMVFVPSAVESKRNWIPFAWGVPSAIAAALLLAVLITGGARFERNDSGFVVALGPVNESPENVQIQPVVGETPDALAIDYASLDYAQIIERIRGDIREAEEAWLRAEIDRVIGTLEEVNNREIQRVRAELQYLSVLQRAAQKDTYQNASYIQRLAQRTGGD